GRAGSGKTAYCLNAVRAELARSLTDGPALILLVPEQAALQMERALLESGPFRTLGRCDVLSFRRLIRRILNDATGPMPDVLSSFGRQMVLRKLIAARSGRWRVLGSVADRPGLIPRLAQCVSEFVQHAVAPDTLANAVSMLQSESSPSRAILDDVAELYHVYRAHLSGTLIDPDGLLDLARDHLDAAPWLSGARIWLDGFAGFTPQQRHLVAALASRAASCEIALLLDPGAACVTDAPDRAELLSLFARTEKTWTQLLQAVRGAGVAIDPPLRLRPKVPPRFTNSGDLATLERDLFHVLLKPPANDARLPDDDDPRSLGASVRLHEYANLRAEVTGTAREIRRLTIGSGKAMRFRDIAVICRDLAPYHDLISATLTEHGIPFFIDRRRPVTHHPLIELVRSALKLLEPTRFAEALPLILKTGLTPLSEDAADLLENAMIERGIRRPDACSAEWWKHRADTDRERDARARVLRARRVLMDAFADWWPAANESAVLPAKQWARRVDELLERLGVSARMNAWVESAQERHDLDEAQIHVQVWNDITSLLEELAAGLGDEALSAQACREVVEAGLSELTLGLVPPTLDQVLVGSIDRSRHPPVRAVFLLGLVDGLFPALPNADPILGDRQRDMLRSAGVELAPSSAERILDERLLAYVAVTRPSERLWLSYPAARDGQPQEPSPFLEHVRAALPELTIEHPPDDSCDVAMDSATTPPALCGRLARQLRRSIAVDDTTPLGALASVYEATRQAPPLRDCLARVLAGLATPKPAHLDATAIAALDSSSPVTSVSRLESFARCPFQHFARYVLRLAPRAVHEIQRIDLGRLSHLVLEHLVHEMIDSGRTLADLSESDLAASLDRIHRDVLPTFAESMAIDEARVRSVSRASQRELATALAAQSRWPRDPQPCRTELAFGGAGAEWPALAIQTPRGRTAELRGKIDRIDLISAGEHTLGIVTDYKRARKVRLVLDSAYHGLSLQLFAYLLALKE
ncbi:MAG: PD-(D/E)XK nuclease family protein, partial [Phycisphaerae bacterium]